MVRCRVWFTDDDGKRKSCTDEFEHKDGHVAEEED